MPALARSDTLMTPGFVIFTYRVLGCWEVAVGVKGGGSDIQNFLWLKFRSDEETGTGHLTHGTNWDRIGGDLSPDTFVEKARVQSIG